MEEMEINEKERASDAMMRRMPAYYRRLLELEGLGFTVISSKELARRMGLTDSQIRHDFNAFGGFGRRGRGYTVELLRKSIGDILDINRKHEMIIIGSGNMGKALAQYKASARMDSTWPRCLTPTASWSASALAGRGSTL